MLLHIARDQRCGRLFRKSNIPNYELLPWCKKRAGSAFFLHYDSAAAFCRLLRSLPPPEEMPSANVDREPSVIRRHMSVNPFRPNSNLIDLSNAEYDPIAVFIRYEPNPNPCGFM